MNKSKMPAILDPPTELSAANGYDLTFASSRATQRTAPAVGPGRFYVAGKRPFEGSRAFAIRFAWMREPRSYPLSSPLAGARNPCDATSGALDRGFSVIRPVGPVRGHEKVPTGGQVAVPAGGHAGPR